MKYKTKGGKDGPSKKKTKIVLDGEVGASPHDDTLGSEDENAPSDHCGSYSDAEDIINDNHIDNDTHVGNIVPHDDVTNNNALDTIIAEEYCEEEVVPQLPPIDDKIASVLTKWLCVLPPREKVKEMFKQCMLPSNVDGLQPVKINSVVYEKLKGSFRVNDQCLRGLNTFLARGLGPLVSVWDKILKWETALCHKDTVPVTGSLGVLHLDGMSLDLTDVRRQLDRGIKLLSTCHSVLLDRRRIQLKPFFDNKFHYLLKLGNPISNELLGDNVDQKVAEASKISDAAQKLQLSRPYNCRSRFRGRFNNRCFSGRQLRRPFFRRDENRPHFSQQYNSHPRAGRARGKRYNNRRFTRTGRN